MDDLSKVEEVLVDSFDHTSKQMSKCDLDTDQGFKRYENFTYFQNGLRVGLDKIEEIKRNGTQCS